MKNRSAIGLFRPKPNISVTKGISQKRVEIHAKNFWGGLVLNFGSGFLKTMYNLYALTIRV